MVQHLDSQDKKFYETNDWWWDHQRIRFLRSQLGLSVLLLAVPVLYFFFLLAFPFYLSILVVEPIFDYNEFLGMLAILLVSGGGFVGAMIIGAYTCQSVMNGIVRLVAFLLTPFHKIIVRRADRYMEKRCSEFNRQTGMISFVMKEHHQPLVVPFVELDGYVERVVQRGGIFYRLMFVHRYTGKQFNQTSLSTIVDHKHEVHALWDMLQRYMDVSQPMPDLPRLEPFRHLDPTTAEHDRQTGRNPRYWRDLDLEAWKAGEGADHLKAQIDYPWSRQRCQLTPQLGKVEMSTYKEQLKAAVA
ncbi:hypothetical protein [Halomonas sp. MCCC 1A11062]|uniref:hypothetical protein n=1 Tax=Halomonas sp. MCCC 1A11062 TaxID=2733485 RepID=UPI001F2B9D1B|nr:hypothetical protein [Halomonas sp. MCCC 1A11062]MCE8038495.1 hypothetical protein [Halomonas sp. MCCC 1A11062]